MICRRFAIRAMVFTVILTVLVDRRFRPCMKGIGQTAVQRVFQCSSREIAHDIVENDASGCSFHDMAVAVPYDSQMIADGKASAVGFGFEHRVLDLVEQIGETIQPLVLQNDHLGIKEHDDIKIRRCIML